MSALFALLVCIPLLILISLSVFGGGQIFMPIFSWFWKLLGSWFGTNISDTDISQAFAVSNATPGILSTKLAMISGYFVANGQWWGFLAMFLTFLIFALPPIFMMHFAMKQAKKSRSNSTSAKLVQIMNPVVTGIVIALAVQLFMGMILPAVVINKSVSQYLALNKDSAKAVFFKDWRQIALLCYVPTGVAISAYLYLRKTPMIWLILGNIVLALLIFEPWLA